MSALLIIGVGRTRMYIDEEGNPARGDVHTLSVMAATTGEVYDLPVDLEVAEMVDSILSAQLEVEGGDPGAQEVGEGVPTPAGSQGAPEGGPAAGQQL